MRQINCLNLTEIIQNLYTSKSDPILDFKTIVKRSSEQAGFEKCERIYIGSYFCAQYFLNIPKKIIEDAMEFCKETDIKITLVIPIFSERNLDKGKEKIQEIMTYLKDIVDEATINDYGMLEYMSKKYEVKLNMGRIFMKDYRELRYPEYFNMTLKPKIFTNYIKKVIKQYGISGMEFDPTHKAVNFEECPKDIEVGVHTPYCYMTVGQICEFASIHKEIEKKFRPNIACQGECNSNIFRYNFNDGHEWLRVGRTIYFENRDCEIQELSSLRNIYFPVDLAVRK